MFFNVDIFGNRLPTGTLCLTYDDGPGQTAGAGPGPRTLELAEYLYDQGIPATFFILGDHAERHPGVLAQLCRWKHTVGNHTATHPGLVALASAGGNVLEEVSRTSALIRSQVSQPITFFGAPLWKLARDGRARSTPRQANVDRRSALESSRSLPVACRPDQLGYLGPRLRLLEKRTVRQGMRGGIPGTDRADRPGNRLDAR